MPCKIDYVKQNAKKKVPKPTEFIVSSDEHCATHKLYFIFVYREITAKKIDAHDQ